MLHFAASHAMYCPNSLSCTIQLACDRFSTSRKHFAPTNNLHSVS